MVDEKINNDELVEMFEQALRNIFNFDCESPVRRKQSREEILEYHKEYYRKNKDKIRQPGTCPTCGHVFADRCSLTRHLKNNVKCKLKRAQQKLQDLGASNSEACTSSSSDDPRDIPAHDGLDFQHSQV